MDEMIFQRGRIVTAFASIEDRIKSITAEYYRNDNYQTLKEDVFDDPYCSFGLTVKVFKKVLGRKGVTEEKFPFEKLEKLQRIRNTAAHGKAEGIVTLNKETQEILSVDKALLHNEGTDHDPEKFVKSFFKDYEIVNDAIASLPGVKLKTYPFKK